MNCLIAGASGLVGQSLLSELLADESVHSVTVFARKPLKTLHPKLKTILLSFDQLETIVLPAADTAFCCLGSTLKKAGSKEAFFKVDHDYVMSFAKGCFNVGVKTFVVVSAIGADENSKIFYNQVKGKTDADLKTIGFQKLKILHPSLLLGERDEARPLEKLAQYAAPLFGKLMVGPLAPYRPIKASQVAKQMKAAAFNGGQSSALDD